MDCSIWVGERYVLLGIIGKQRQIEYHGNPVSIDQEERGQKGVNSGFGDDVGVQAVAEVDGVYVITI